MQTLNNGLLIRAEQSAHNKNNMKTNSINYNGCSVCEQGKENYTTFRPTHRPKQTFYQYDYRHTNGKLFSTVAPTLEGCRTRRDEWLTKKNDNINI